MNLALDSNVAMCQSAKVKSDNTSQIPQPLHDQLSKQGKEGVKVLTHELRSKGGKNSWRVRLKKAQEAAKAKEGKI